jgi:hypothetical protein
MAGNHRFCTKCQVKHASPTGKKCRRPVMDPEPDLEVMPEAAEGGVQLNHTDAAEIAVTDISPDRFDALVSVISDLASRVDATQRRLDALQIVPQSALHTQSSDAMSSSGAIPKRPTSMGGQGCSVPHLQELRSDVRAVEQANRMVDAMESSVPGNHSVRPLRRGWARPGGDNAPRVAVPWPQDYVIGHGRKSRLTYDDLTVFDWTQGCLAIIEREEDMETARGMLALLRATLRDAAYHGFEAARYSYGCILSMMEDGSLSWADSTRIAEERRSALIARGTVVPAREVFPSSGSRRGFGGNAGKGSDSKFVKNNNNPNSPGAFPRPCVFWNNGVCTQRTDHQTGGILWKHVCRRCLESSHTDKECPLMSTGTGRS